MLIVECRLIKKMARLIVGNDLVKFAGLMKLGVLSTKFASFLLVCKKERRTLPSVRR